MDWDDHRLLLEVHRGGSFLVAGQRLLLSASTVQRRITALEKRLGRAVVQRTARGVSLEPEAVSLIQLASSFERALATHERERSGVVRVSVPEGLAPLVTAAATRCQAAHPDLIVELSIELRYVDLGLREADIAVRGGRSASKVLIERRAGDVASALCASRIYLARHLPSRRITAHDYERLAFIADDGAAKGLGPFSWLYRRGARSFPFRASSLAARFDAARAGLGVTICASGQPVPGLEPITMESPGPSIPFYVVMHRDLKHVPRMRAMATALRELFSEAMR